MDREDDTDSDQFISGTCCAYESLLTTTDLSFRPGRDGADRRIASRAEQSRLIPRRVCFRIEAVH